MIRIKNSINILPCLFIFSFLFLCSCQGRDPANPFDPDNSSTHGEPTGLIAIAGSNQVALSWPDFDQDDLVSVYLSRRHGETDNILLPGFPRGPSIRNYIDETVDNNCEYEYKLGLMFADSSITSLETALAEPGTGFPWVADPCGYGTTLLSPDCRQVRRECIRGYPVLDIDIDRTGHRVFAAQIDIGQVVILCSTTGDQLGEIACTGASCVSWLGTQTALAVGSFYEQQVSWFTDQGEMLNSLSVNGYTEDIAFRDSSTTWVALHGAGVQRLAFATGVRDSVPVHIGRAVAIEDDPGLGCWVADRDNGVVLYIADDLSVTSSAVGVFSRPLDLSPGEPGFCWVADNTNEAIYLINRSCELVEMRADLGKVTSVAYDPVTSSLWTSCSAEGHIYRYSATGNSVRYYFPGCPRKIEGDWAGEIR